MVTDVVFSLAALILLATQVLLLGKQGETQQIVAAIERERRIEEGALLNLHVLGEAPELGFQDGRLFRFAWWNDGQRAQLAWNADLLVIGSSVGGQYKAALAIHEETFVLDDSFTFAPRTAGRIRALLRATPAVASAMNGAWIYLRFITPEGPFLKLVEQGTSPEPSAIEQQRGMRSPKT